MTDIDNYITTLQIAWIKRLTADDFANWKVIPTFYFNKFGANFMLLYMNPDNIYSIQNLHKTLPKFYLEIVKSWFKVQNLNNTKLNMNFKNIRQQILWGNKLIKFQGKCLVFINWIKEGIIYVNDIIDQNGNISQEIISNKISSKSNLMFEISKLNYALPNEWLKVLKSEKSIKSKVKNKLNLCINTKEKNKIISLQVMETKQIYTHINSGNEDTPSSFFKWKRVLNLDSLIPIKSMLNFVFTYLKDNRLKIFKWKLLHHILPCKQLLFQWKI